MIRGSELKVGSVVRQGDDFLRVVALDFTGAARAERSLRLKFKNLLKGNQYDAHVKADDQFEEADLSTHDMEYLYDEDDNLVFMDSVSFEQYRIPSAQIGSARAFLKPNMVIPIQCHHGSPIHVLFPKSVEALVTQAPHASGEADSTFKEAEIENGMKILVPQFIKTGDKIHVDVETGKYLDRVKKEK